MLRLHNKKEIDIKGGKFTLSQRNELGDLLSSDKTDVEKFEGIFEILYSFKPSPLEYKLLINVFNRTIDGLNHWFKSERDLLKYDYDADELSAGIKEYSEKIGALGTVLAIAKTFGKDPDEILSWEYGKVFGILLNDLESSKYRERYDKVLQRKFKIKT